MNNNQTVKIHDKEFAPYFSADKLSSAVKKMAAQINEQYQNQTPLFLSVLNGSFMFTSDLLKEVNIDCELSFIKVSSYSGTSSTGQVSSIIGLNQDVKNRNLIILEDIVDTGNTIEKLISDLEQLNPASIKVAAMFFKPEAYKKSRKIDYVGIEISNEFIVGYGLDYNERGRNLPEVYKIV